MSDSTERSRASVANPDTSMAGSVNAVGSPYRLVTLGLQHLFIMYAGAVAVPLIVGPAVGLDNGDVALLISADLLVSGITSIIQSAGIGKVAGVRLPIVAGATFTVVNPMIIIADQYGGRSGLPVVYGALLIAGVFGLLIAKPFSMMLRFFPPLVTGIVISMIGLSLIGADVGLIAGNKLSEFIATIPVTGKDALPLVRDGSVVTKLNPDSGQISHILLGASVILMIVTINRFFSGFISQVAVLISIVVGTVIAWPMGQLNFSGLSKAHWVGISSPFHFGHPQFKAAAVISMCIVILVVYTESTADILAVGEMVAKPLGPNDLARGVVTDGLSAIIAAFMNSFPDTAYAQNVGLVGMTRVRSRWVATVCGIMLVVLGLIPKAGALVADLPTPVIGGAATVMFAMVIAIGIQTLHKAPLGDNHNLLIVAISLAVGLIPAVQPAFYEHFPRDFQVIFGSSITSTAIVAFSLNLIFNHWRKAERKSAGQAEGEITTPGPSFEDYSDA
jgi:uric acid transporter